MGLLDEIEGRKGKGLTVYVRPDDFTTLLRLARLAERAMQRHLVGEIPEWVGAMQDEAESIFHPEPPVPEGPFSVRQANGDGWVTYDTRTGENSGSSFYFHKEAAMYDCAYQNRTWQDGYRAARKGGA